MRVLAGRLVPVASDSSWFLSHQTAAYTCAWWGGWVGLPRWLDSVRKHEAVRLGSSPSALPMYTSGSGLPGSAQAAWQRVLLPAAPQVLQRAQLKRQMLGKSRGGSGAGAGSWGQGALDELRWGLGLALLRQGGAAGAGDPACQQ